MTFGGSTNSHADLAYVRQRSRQLGVEFQCVGNPDFDVFPARLDAAIYPYAIEITTRLGDMDVNHHLNNVAYARYFEEARVTFNSDGLLTDRGHRLPALLGLQHPGQAGQQGMEALRVHGGIVS